MAFQERIIGLHGPLMQVFQEQMMAISKPSHLQLLLLA